MKKTVLLGLLTLCSCEATQSDREKTLPVALHTEQRTIPLTSGGMFDASQVQLAIADLGKQTEISTDIIGMVPEKAEQLVPELMTLGLDPDRVHIAPLTTRYRAVPPHLVLSRTQVALADCSKTIRSGWLGDVTPSVENVGRCVQNNNLAQMLADPSDLYRSPAFHPSSAERAALSVRHLNQGQQPALPADALGTGSSASGGMAGGASGGTTTDTQSQSSTLP
nr:hypothetical protein [uncultured Acetobacter sp.]